MDEVLAQAFTQDSLPGWLLTGITSVAGFLFWQQLKEIKLSLKEALDIQKKHGTEIEVLKTKHDVHVENLEKLDLHGKEQYEKIIEKLEALQ